MREGYGADDAWMMVEDEFFATAQLYTQHLHHAAYAEQKRRAQARGEKVLRTLGRPTDGRTERDAMVVEREERAKGIQKALGLDKEDDEGDLTDPLLGALMNDHRRMGRALEGVGKVKSKSRAANGFLRSPEKARRTFAVEDLDAGDRAVSNDFSEADSDDLDGPVARPRKPDTTSTYKVNQKTSAPKVDPRRETSVFKKMAAAKEERPHNRAQPDRLAANNLTEKDDHASRSKVRSTNDSTSSKPFTTSIDDFEPSKPSIKEETPSYLIKRRQRKEEEEKRKAKEKKAAVEVPTFII
jgi:hypothetical protein